MKSLQNQWKSERMCQRTHIQNHAYANNSSYTYVRDVRELSSPALIITSQLIFSCSNSTIETLEKDVKYVKLTIKTPERRQ